MVDITIKVVFNQMDESESAQLQTHPITNKAEDENYGYPRKITQISPTRKSDHLYFRNKLD